jgi:acetyl-CoA C-acetyltransferase
MAGVVMGETVETLVDELKISRAEQDEFAAGSQQKSEKARSQGWFDDEIVPVLLNEKKQSVYMTSDEHPRDGITAEKLTKLKPVYDLQDRDGTITAGNASGITDGASALVLTTPEKAREMGWERLGAYQGGAVVGCDPERMGLGPVHAVKEIERRFGRNLDSFELVELNEAFAAQVLACQRTLKIPDEKLNPNGGAISLGHPIGCTGNRMAVTLLHELRRRGGGRGLATLCVSGGLGIAGMFEV